MRSVPVWAVFTPATYTSAAGCGTFTDRIRHAAGPAGAGPGPSGSTRGQTFTVGGLGRGDAAYSPTQPNWKIPGCWFHCSTSSRLPITPGIGP